MTINEIEIGTYVTDGTEYAIVEQSCDAPHKKNYAWCDITDQPEDQEAAIFVTDMDEEQL